MNRFTIHGPNPASMFAALVASLLPSNVLRCLAYRLLFRYDIQRSSIGLGTILLVKAARLEHCRVGKFNRFVGPMTVIIGKDATVGPFNEFSCGSWTLEERFKDADYMRYLSIGEQTVITSNHVFDIVGSFILGKMSWIAGKGSQFWTHGVGVEDRNVSIGEGCYVGSAVRFVPGASIANNCLVAIGSVVTNKLSEDNTLVAGVPARIIKRNYDWKARLR